MKVIRDYCNPWGCQRLAEYNLGTTDLDVTPGLQDLSYSLHSFENK